MCSEPESSDDDDEEIEDLRPNTNKKDNASQVATFAFKFISDSSSRN